MNTTTEWDLQKRIQLVEDLYYTCANNTDNGDILEAILDEYVYLLKDNKERLDELKGWVNYEGYEEDEE